VFWENISSIIGIISEKNILNISMFSMDSLAIIILFALNQYNPTEGTHEKWSKDIWQDTLYLPYKTIVHKEISEEMNLNVIFCLNKILQNCGTIFSARGWNAFIDVCHTLITKEEEEKIYENGKLLNNHILLNSLFNKSV